MSFEIAQTLDEEVSWLADIIGKRMAGEELPVLPEPPRFSFPEVSYARFCQEHSLGPEERLVLVLALVPHYAPDILKAMASEENEAFLRMDKDGFLQPTGETALFLIAGTDRKRRLEFAPLLEAGHVFYRKDVIDLQQVAPGRSRFSGGLFMNRSRVEQFFYGRYQRPRFSPEFPAHLLESKLEWDDLVLANRRWKSWKNCVPGWNLKRRCAIVWEGTNACGGDFAVCFTGQVVRAKRWLQPFWASIWGRTYSVWT
jgi:hypothetical protein